MVVTEACSRGEGMMGGERRKMYSAIKSIKKKKNKATKPHFQGTVDLLIYNYHHHGLVMMHTLL